MQLHSTGGALLGTQPYAVLLHGPIEQGLPEETVLEGDEEGQ